jgi:FtsH-binding integral membrane protein
LTFVVSFIVSATSSDGWVGLGAVIMMLFATAIVLGIVLVIGIVKYSKNKSQFGLGLIYGITGILIFGVVSSFLISLYNMVV